MKRISLVLASLVGSMALVACGSGGGSSGGGENGDDVPSGCANGASQCGASATATLYDQKFLNHAGSLITATNVVIGDGESVALTFGVKDIESPVTVNFTSSGGNLQSAPSYTFGDNESSYTFVLQTNNSVSSYTITPTESGQNSLPPVTVNSIASTKFLLPTGRYLISGTSLWYDISTPSICGLDNMTGLNVQMVNTTAGVYICFKDFRSGVLGCQLSNVAPTNTSRVPEETMPSGSKFNQDFNLTGYYSNAYWSNNTFSSNSSVDFCPYVDNVVLTYQTSSTVLPYPVFPSNQATGKSLFGSQRHVNLFGFVR